MNFMNAEIVLLNCLDLGVYLSISATIQALTTCSLITSEHNAISFSNTKRDSSYILYEIYGTKFASNSWKNSYISNGGCDLCFFL